VKKISILNGFNPETYKGGIETFILNLRDVLLELGSHIDIHYIYPETTLPIKPFPLTFIRKEVPEMILNCYMMGRAFSQIEREYDLVITNNYYGLGYFSPRVKSIAIYHSTHAGYADSLKRVLTKKDHRILKYIYGYIGDFLSGKGKAKIAVSQNVASELRKYYRFRDITIIHHGIDTNFFKKIEDVTPLRKKWNIPSNAFVGIFVGRWEIGKGIDILNEVIQNTKDTIWLLAVGPSECPLPCPNNIRIIKNADTVVMRELYSLSDFMLLPSYYEGFGLTIIEAMACKLPVICTEVGVAKDFLRFDTLQRLILPNCDKPELIKEINDRISFLKNSGHEKKEIANTGRPIIERDYNMDTWKKKIYATLGFSDY
jgi:glycosyltransferase involved in cell wall biosynthesis